MVFDEFFKGFGDRDAFAVQLQSIVETYFRTLAAGGTFFSVKNMVAVNDPMVATRSCAVSAQRTFLSAYRQLRFQTSAFRIVTPYTAQWAAF